MTYCVGILVAEGLVMIADTRTNAGIDNISTFRKLHTFETPGERALGIATSGNLSVSQSVLSMLNDGVPNIETGQLDTLHTVPSMVAAAQLIGRAMRKVYEIDGPALEEHGMHFNMKVLLGGQIRGGPMRLFHIYAEGNSIEATADTPFLQIGEPKYGKPILDRAISHGVDIRDALKIGLISMDSTLQSNLSVGLPVDILVVRRDELKAGVECRITEQDAYFRDLRERWSMALRAAHLSIPHPPYADCL
jgi:putative proteasome-type protease